MERCKLFCVLACTMWWTGVGVAAEAQFPRHCYNKIEG